MNRYLQRYYQLWIPAGLVLLTFLTRMRYLINFPLFQDEGTFLVDCRNYFHVYERSLFMKPPLAVLPYFFADRFPNPFFVLHLMTNIEIALSIFILYLIIYAWTESRMIAVLGCLTFLYLTNCSPMAYGHSSIEYFQNVFLLLAFWLLFVCDRFYIGVVSFFISALILHNVLAATPAIFNLKRDGWKPVILVLGLFFITGLLILKLFPNILFDCLIFPSQYYNQLAGFHQRLANLLSNMHNPITIGLVSFSLPGMVVLFQKNRRALAFTILVYLSVLLTKFIFSHHLMTLYPFMVILAAFTLSSVISFLENRLPARSRYLSYPLSFYIKGALLTGLVISLFHADLHSGETINHRMAHKIFFSELDNLRSNQIIDILSNNHGKTAYIYPSLASFIYPITQTPTLSTYASNDQIDIILAHAFLREKLVNTIIAEKPYFLIQTSPSVLDSDLARFLAQNYQCIRTTFTLCTLKH